VANFCTQKPLTQARKLSTVNLELTSQNQNPSSQVHINLSDDPSVVHVPLLRHCVLFWQASDDKKQQMMEMISSFIEKLKV